MRERVAEWSRETGVAVRWREEYAGAARDFRTNPCVDFGRLEERIPEFVLRPATVEQLALTLRFLGDERRPYALRGTGHSSGGQALSDSAVVDLAGLRRISLDEGEDDTITVEAGVTWRDACAALYPTGRRPVTLPINLVMSCGGVLAVGGFGDTTHRHGLAAAHVRALTLCTPDGAIRELVPGDPLFDHALCGRGQLGAIARARLATLRRPTTMRARLVRWPTVEAFLDDAVALPHELLRMRMFYAGRRASAAGVVGEFGDECSDALPRASQIRPPETIDLARDLARDHRDDWTLAGPSLDLLVPHTARGLVLLRELDEAVAAAGLARFLPAGGGVVPVSRQPSLPLAPLPDAERSFGYVVRPEVPAARLAEVVTLLRQLARRALDEGARIYLMSTLPAASPEELFGPSVARLRALKAEVDPHGLCNPGVLS